MYLSEKYWLVMCFKCFFLSSFNWMNFCMLVFMHLSCLSCVREEVFGPVAPLLLFKTEEEAIRLANDTNAGSFSGHDLYFNARNSKRTKYPSLSLSLSFPWSIKKPFALHFCLSYSILIQFFVISSLFNFLVDCFPLYFHRFGCLRIYKQHTTFVAGV